MNLPVQMMSLQFSGEIDLPTAGSNVIQRHVGVDFSCPVEEASVSEKWRFVKKTNVPVTNCRYSWE